MLNTYFHCVCFAASSMSISKYTNIISVHTTCYYWAYLVKQLNSLKVDLIEFKKKWLFYSSSKNFREWNQFDCKMIINDVLLTSLCVLHSPNTLSQVNFFSPLEVCAITIPESTGSERISFLWFFSLIFNGLMRQNTRILPVNLYSLKNARFCQKVSQKDN